MIKRQNLLMMIFVLSSVWILGCGCSNNGPPEKTTNEKLNSDNPDEQMEGLDEADEKFGAEQ